MMSIWTHITATVFIDTCTNTEDIESYVKDSLKNAPRITGSEGDANVFVNAMVGYNESIYGDCDKCRFLLSDGNCSASVSDECVVSNYQTNVAITIVGMLRDKRKNSAEKEFKAFLKYILDECDFYIINTAKCIREH